MTPSLRMRVVEAGAHAIAEIENYAPGFSGEHWTRSEATLGAFLDCLAETADEFRREFWSDLAAAPEEPADMVDELIRVLRESDDE